MTIRFLAILLVVFLLCTSCNSRAQTLTLVTARGSFPFKIEVVDTPEKREHGLMSRTSMPADAGMLFVWPHVVSDPFWMKNTPLSLDMIFVDQDKKVVCVVPHTIPESTDLIQCPHFFRYVLETVAGAAEKCGLQIGDQVIIR